ncbi:MAG: type II secretion system protein GspK [Chthoniobacteraceae bacterium]|nr:type II secretion system protein GspK [Chthoniobacteraceae bacterium]
MKRAASGVSGSTLMLALWALVLLSAVVFAWVRSLDRDIDAMNAANRAMEARALAHSGITVALHPNITRASPHLQARYERNRSYRVTIQSEGGRLNLNYFLAGGDPAKIAFLKDYLAQSGLTIHEREVFLDNLRDWVSPAGGTRLRNGVAESPAYQPAHRPLQSLDEIRRIAGSAPFVSRPHWQDGLTLFSTGPLDLESVPADLLALIPGVGEQRARRFVKLREERERAGGDRAGYPFENVAEAIGILGLSEEQGVQLSGFLGFRDPVVRIRSIGQSENVIRQTDAIVSKALGASAQILYWNEK